MHEGFSSYNGEFHQVHEVRKSLSRLKPYAKVRADQEGRNRGKSTAGSENSTLKERECSGFEEPKDGERGHNGGGKGKPDKSGEMGTQCHPRSLHPSG